MRTYCIAQASLVAQMVKNLPAMRERPGFDPWVRKTSGERNSYPLEQSGLENSMDRGARQAILHGIAKLDRTKWLFHFSLYSSKNPSVGSVVT